MHTRYVLRHARGSLFASRLAPTSLGFSMETLAVVDGATETETADRAELVRQAIAAAGRGYVPGRLPALARVA
jgi:hypothetical protein